MIFGYIVFQFQDRIFVRLDIPALLEDIAVDEAGLQAARSAKEAQETEKAQELASSHSSGASAASQVDEATRAFRANAIRIALVVLVVAINIMLPLIWMTTTPQIASYRQCAGDNEETWRQLVRSCMLPRIMRRSHEELVSLYRARCVPRR